MDYVQIFMPVALFLGVVVLAAAVYFIVTWIKGRVSEGRERRGSGRGAHRR